VARNNEAARVRLAALQSLQALPAQLLYHKLHPHRAMVIRDVLDMLNDRKRVVRRAAADVRNDWILMPAR
jgi:hypothetical protein